MFHVSDTFYLMLYMYKLPVSQWMETGITSPWHEGDDEYVYILFKDIRHYLSLFFPFRLFVYLCFLRNFEDQLHICYTVLSMTLAKWIWISQTVQWITLSGRSRWFNSILVENYVSALCIQCFNWAFLLVDQNLSVIRRVISEVQSSQFFVI